MAYLCLESDDGVVRQRHGNLLLYLCQEGEKKRGQATEVCQSHKGNDLHPSRRLGKHGTCRKSQDGLIILKVGRATSMAAHYRGVSITENIAPSNVRDFLISGRSHIRPKGDIHRVLVYVGNAA